MEYICKECGGGPFKNQNAMSAHLRGHKIKPKDYYLKHIDPSAGHCKVCGTGEPEFLGLDKGFRTYCCAKCMNADSKAIFKDANAKRAATLLAKTGYANAMQNPEVAKKSAARSKEALEKKYGVSNANYIPGVKEKQSANNVMHKIPIRMKQQASLIKSIGVDNPFKSKAIMDKVVANRIERTGFANPMQNPDVQKKAAATYKENHDTNILSGSSLESFIKQTAYEQDLAKRLAEYSCKLLYHENKRVIFLCSRCGNVNDTYPQWRNGFIDEDPCIYCHPTARTRSNDEEKIGEFVRSICEEDILFNDHTVLPNNQKLDIYIPSKHIAIEYDGVYFHSSKFIDDPNYHLKKTEECAKQGIRLIHVFSDEWLAKPDIVKSRLQAILGKSSERIYARKTEVRIIEDSNVIYDFLEKNHLQGYAQSSYRYGLYLGDRLVAMMTFGKSRFKSNQMELIRYCSVLNTTVVGGAGKLFKAFLADHPEYTEVMSYADRRWSDGSLYKSLGFNLQSISKPSYSYVKNGRTNRLSRFSAQKEKLIKAGFDPNLTEEQIMNKMLDCYKLFDCGNYVFVYNQQMSA